MVSSISPDTALLIWLVRSSVTPITFLETSKYEIIPITTNDTTTTERT
jgi:hypothetical protein